jgi:hypothetical protein
LVLATVLLFCWGGIPNNNPPNRSAPAGDEVAVVKPLQPELEVTPLRPSAPTPKAAVSPDLKTDLDLAGGNPGSAAIQPTPDAPVKPAIAESYETPTQRRVWYALMIAGHGTAAFDAWTTRRAISGGYGVEGDPLQKPFATSGAIYATTQVVPLIMDYVGRRMMRSSHSWMRKAWWVPQSTSSALSLSSGVHNYGVVPSWR